MTNAEFSDTFTTLLNSYNTQAQFGEQASRQEIVLDEYEKSVLLTQAQDIIVKSYFDRSMNQQGQGFDDSTRRQMDFSSLIKTAELVPIDSALSDKYKFDDRGIVYKLPRKKIPTANMKSDASAGTYTVIEDDPSHVYVEGTTDVLFILNEKLTRLHKSVFSESFVRVESTNPRPVNINLEKYGDGTTDYEVYPETSTVYIAASSIAQFKNIFENEVLKLPFMKGINIVFDANIFQSFEIGDQVHIKIPASTSQQYVVVPISYKEYDREMSKPYAQPLKKQAWRLFQNQASTFDINSELIPKFNVTLDPDVRFIYKIRYVKRPKPIILETLPNGLEIDGEYLESDCELNPIIHMDILNKAVELAITTRGGRSASPSQGTRERRED